MDCHFIDDHCANCATPFSCASQIFPTITVVDETNCSKIQEITILDAILFIHGFSATNLASAYLDEEVEEILPSHNKLSETGDYIMKSGLSLCNNCVVVFKEVYVAYHQLKKLSTQEAILSKAIKKFAPTYIKVEIDDKGSKDATGGGEVGDTVNLKKRAANTVRLRKTPPEKLAIVATEEDATKDSVPDELFQEFNVKEEYDDYESCQEDANIDPLAETELTNVYVLVSSFDAHKNDGLVTEDLPIVPQKKSTTRQGRGRPRKASSKMPFSGLGGHDLQTKKRAVGQSQGLSLQKGRKRKKLTGRYAPKKRMRPVKPGKKPLTDDDLLGNGYESVCNPKNVRAEQSSQNNYHKDIPYATPSSVISTEEKEKIRQNNCGVASSCLQCLRVHENYALDEQDPLIGVMCANTTKITKLPSEIVTIQKRKASTECYPNKSIRPANATLPLSSTRIHLTRRTASFLSSIETNGQMSNSEIVPKTVTEQTEVPEIQAPVKRITSEKQKEAARLNLQKARKRKKYTIGRYTSRRRMRQKQLAKKPLTDDDLFEKCYEKVTKPENVTSEQFFENNDDDLFEKCYEKVTKPENVTGEKSFENIDLNESSNSTSSVSSVILGKPKEVFLKCTCGFVTSSLQCLRLHENEKPHEQEPLVCDICAETFMKNYLLYAHKTMKHDEMPELSFKCALCNTKFLQKTTLKVHVLQHHSAIPNPFVCDKCGRGFSCSQYLMKHNNAVHKDENLDKELFKCKECGLQLKHNRSLKKHIRLMHRSQKTFICEQCGKTTKNMTNMRIHMKVHDPNRIVKKKIASETTKTSVT